MKPKEEESKMLSCSSGAKKATRCVSDVLTKWYSKLKGVCKSKQKSSEKRDEDCNPWLPKKKRDEKATRKSLGDVINHKTPKPREII